MANRIWKEIVLNRTAHKHTWLELAAAASWAPSNSQLDDKKGALPCPPCFRSS